MADDAGALLVRSGLVSATALEDARARVADEGGTLGEQLVATGAVADNALTEFYRARLLVPQVNPNTLARLPAKVVAMIPADLAIELRAIPVAVDAEQNLTVAMSDPADRHAVDEIAFFTHAYIVRAVATQMQIAWCLAHYYGHVTVLGQRLLRPQDGSPPAEPSPRPSRPRGMTSRIAAERHRAIAPVALEPGGGAAGDAIPQPAPRAHSISGEIRVVKPRAQSIKPPLPEDSSGPTISIEPSGPTITAEPSGPTITVEPSGPVITIEVDDATDQIPVPPRPQRKKPAKTDPPELAARAGEVEQKTGKIVAIDDEPRVVIADDLGQPAVSGEIGGPEADTHSTVRETIRPGDEVSAPVMIHDAGLSLDSAPTEVMSAAPSQPILLDRRRTGSSNPPLAAADDVLVLEPKRTGAKRRGDRRTQLGIGVLPAVTRPSAEPARPHRDTEADGVPSELDDLPTASRAAVDFDPTRIDATAAPAGDATPSEDVLAAPPSPGYDHDQDQDPDAPPPGPSAAVPPPSGRVALDNVRRAPTRNDDDDEDGASGLPTQVMTAIEIDEAVESTDVRAARESDEVDDGWGPPGTTIPPPLLGAMPGTTEHEPGVIPMPNVDSAPLIVAPPSAPEVTRPGTDAGLGRALEHATARVLELLRVLEQAADRDEVIAAMIAHLAESHRRAGFFAVRGGELHVFAMKPRPAVLPFAPLRLDRPSTMQDVVDTHLPYRGPIADEASRSFLIAALGACPPEILLVPVTLRERVVGVVFAEYRLRHTFDDQLALAARAAGMALERILKARRG